MQKKWIWGGVGLAVLGMLLWAFIPSAQEVELATVTQGRFERFVQEDGKARVRDRYVVSTPLTGRLERIVLKQGDAVQRDGVVARLWPLAPALLDARTRAEQGERIGAMEASVARAQANVGRAVAALEQARAELKRSETLARQGFVSPNQNESGRLNVRLREKELESARQEVDAASHQLVQSRIAVQQFSSGAGVGDAQRALVVKAPVSGKVLRVVQQSEGIVAAGTPLLELGDPAQLEVVVDVLTEDAAQIQPGTPVRLANWGGLHTLDGQVRLVEPSAFTKVSALGVEEQRVNAIVEIASPSEHWRALGDGFKVDVRVLVQVEDNAILVPVSAVFPVGSRSGLFLLEGGKARLQLVDVAARNGVDAWVKSGLNVGAKVIVYPDATLEDGARVQARKL